MKKSTTILLVAALITVAALATAYVVIRAIWYAPSGEVLLPSAEKTYAADNDDPTLYPVALVIPAINVDAAVDPVGVTKSGNMATPDNFTDVGWFRYGVLPGEQGSAVIAGHVDDGLAFPAVFANLDELKPGDDIYVTTAQGKNIHYVVTALNIYNYNAPTQDIFEQNDAPYLKLITCAGTWIPAQKTHNQRLVVTAVMVP